MQVTAPANEPGGNDLGVLEMVPGMPRWAGRPSVPSFILTSARPESPALVVPLHLPPPAPHLLCVGKQLGTCEQWALQIYSRTRTLPAQK